MIKTEINKQMSQIEEVKSLFNQKYNQVLLVDWDEYREGKLLAKFFYNDATITKNLVLLFVHFLTKSNQQMTSQEINFINQTFHSFDDLNYEFIRSQIKTIAFSHGFIFVLG